MSYRLKKKLRTLKAAGINPRDWLYEVSAKLVSHKIFRLKSPNDASNNPRLKHLFALADILPEHFTYERDVPDEEIIACLAKYGVCVIQNYVSHEQALNAGKSILSFYDGRKCETARSSAANRWEENETFIWQTDHAWSDNYLQIANATKPVINIRSRESGAADAGMIDIFNIEKLSQSESLQDLASIIRKVNSEKLTKLISGFCDYPQRQSNLYINRSITDTRGPHIDNNSDPFKAFVYLTDVTTAELGPYCYLPTSHIGRRWMSFERLKNAILGLPSTEVSSFSRERMTKLFGKAGTLIITNQSGIHCGWPQKKNSERVVLVSNFY